MVNRSSWFSGLSTIALAACAVACVTPVVLAWLGVGVATAVVCNVYEAAGLVALGGAATVAALVKRRGSPAEDACGCTAAGPVSGPEERAIPLACDLGVFTPEERAEHVERSRRLFASVDRCDEEADGYSFAFSSVLEDEVRRWIEKERRCCPFFRFAVERPAEGALVLRVSGPGAAKEILRAELAELGRVSPASR